VGGSAVRWMWPAVVSIEGTFRRRIRKDSTSGHLLRPECGWRFAADSARFVDIAAEKLGRISFAPPDDAALCVASVGLLCIEGAG